MLKKVYKRRLLFIEDDGAVTESLGEYFKKQQNTVICANSVEEASEYLDEYKFDAIILDIILPDGNGIDLLENRKNLPPVIILSTLSDEDNMLSGFQAGAADYIVKPCSPELLEARLSLRLAHGELAIIRLSGITLDVSERTVFYDDKPVQLTSSEFNILYFLMSHPDEFYDASEIYSRVWDAPSLQTTTVRYHISNLRRKIKDITQKNLIITEFGKGYAFTVRHA